MESLNRGLNRNTDNKGHSMALTICILNNKGGVGQLVLRDFVREAGAEFDVILIDCPPNIYLSAWSALCASDAVIVPVQPEDYGAQGIAFMREVIAAVQAGPNASLNLLGYLIT